MYIYTDNCLSALVIIRQLDLDLFPLLVIFKHTLSHVGQVLGTFNFQKHTNVNSNVNPATKWNGSYVSFTHPICFCHRYTFFIDFWIKIHDFKLMFKFKIHSFSFLIARRITFHLCFPFLSQIERHGTKQGEMFLCIYKNLLLINSDIQRLAQLHSNDLIWFWPVESQSPLTTLL